MNESDITTVKITASRRNDFDRVKGAVKRYGGRFDAATKAWTIDTYDYEQHLAAFADRGYLTVVA